MPVASFTVTKLRWLAEHEPGNARRTAAVCLPHDWLTWRLAGAAGLERSPPTGATPPGPVTGRPRPGAYRTDLLQTAFGAVPDLPRVLGPDGRRPGARGRVSARRRARATTWRRPSGSGPDPGDVVVSIGTSGTAFAVAGTPERRPERAVAGFADATGRFLPLVCTLNAARVLDAAARMLGVGLDRSRRAGAAGSRRVPAASCCVPYLEGERTPNLPDATGLAARADPEHRHPRAPGPGGGGGHALRSWPTRSTRSGSTPARVLLIGGGARSEAVRRIAPAVFGRARASSRSRGSTSRTARPARPPGCSRGGAEPPVWEAGGTEHFEADATPDVRSRYAEARDSR